MTELDKDMEHMRNSFSDFKERRALQEPAENMKMVVVGILILSVVAFSILGKEVVKHFIWYWAAFMVLLLLGCLIQDIRISREIKRRGIDL